MRGSSAETIADKIFSQPTMVVYRDQRFHKVIVRDKDPNWFAVNVIVRKNDLFKAITELRGIGGSGVVVQPVSYIFEEEPPRYIAMLKALESK